jgi:hypothetical protein
LTDVTTVAVGSHSVAPEVDVRVASLGDVREAARSAASELLWIVGDGAVASPHTLEALVDARCEPAASLPVDAGGEPVEFALGRFTEDDPALLLACADEGRVPLRRAPVTSLLVARATVLGHDAPDPDRYQAHAGTEWTGRVFAERPGMLVVASAVRVPSPPRGGTVGALRAARAGGWGAGETVRALRRSLLG